jgi:hypothetical protein
LPVGYTFILVGRGELNAVSGGKPPLVLSKHADTLEAARIECDAAVAPLHSQQVLIAIDSGDAGVFAGTDAEGSAERPSFLL